MVFAMNEYKKALHSAQAHESMIRKKYNNLNFAPANSPSNMGWTQNNNNYFAQLKENAMTKELNRIHYPKIPSAQITYAGNAKKFWRAGRPHQQTDLRKLTQERLAEKQRKYGTVVSGHVNYTGGRNALNRAK